MAIGCRATHCSKQGGGWTGRTALFALRNFSLGDSLRDCLPRAALSNARLDKACLGVRDHALLLLSPLGDLDQAVWVLLLPASSREAFTRRFLWLGRRGVLPPFRRPELISVVDCTRSIVA